MKVLVLGAGGPAGVNTCRALIAAGHDTFAGDDNREHLVWTDAVGASRWQGEPVDVVLCQPDALVRGLHLFRINAATFQPPLDVIKLCQAKDVAANIWADTGLRGAPVCIREPYPDHLHFAADQFGLPFWLRANRGAGANKAIKASTLAEGFHWLRFWAYRGADVEWIAEPYLPGRDIAWTSIWYEGQLLTAFARERIEYIYPHLSPEGLTGTPTRARIIVDDRVTEIGEQAVRAVAAEPHGIFSVDLREDEFGVPRPTEINAGRGFTTLGLWSLHSVNFYDLAVQCAVHDPYMPGRDPLPEGLTLSRHIDCGHVFTEAPVTV